MQTHTQTYMYVYNKLNNFRVFYTFNYSISINNNASLFIKSANYILKLNSF